ncbi:MAG: hypothetical protein KGS60_10155 [Verrucomicrobia bacterium]|nr:hypothetical protein [Verrucomicrobiota bacterium]
MKRIAFPLALFLVPGASGQLATPALETVFPCGGRAGSETILQISGTDLEAVRALTFAHPGITGERVMLPAGDFWPEPRPDGLKFRVRIAADVPPGLHEVRGSGEDGFSTGRVFAVSPGGAPEEALHPGVPHLTLSNPFPILLEQTVNGRLTAQQANYHRLALRAGDRVVLQVAALALDSRADLRIAVLDASGRELAAERGNGERDPRLDFRAAQDGDHVISVHDLLYRGGDAYAYRLVVSKAPTVDALEPMAIRPGESVPLTVIGRNLPGGKPWTDGRWESVTFPVEGGEAAPMTIDGLKPGHAAARRASVALPWGALGEVGLADRPVVPEGSVAPGQSLALPVEVGGRIDFPGNIDVYRFAAKAGESVEVTAVSYRQGMDTDLALTVQRVVLKDGAEVLEPVAESDDLFTVNTIGLDTRIRDPGLVFKAAADGVYQVELRNLGDDYGPAQGYRLRIGPAAPGLVLFAAEERPHLTLNQAYPGAAVLAPGHRMTIRVIAVRSGGLAGPVKLSAKNLPPGVKTLGGVIWPQASEGRLVLEAGAEATPWQGMIEVLGECAGVTVPALGATLKRGMADQTKEKAASRLTSGVALAVCTAGAPRFTVEVLPEANQVELGKDLTFKIRVERKGAVKGPVTVTPSGLPGFTKPPVLTIAEKDSEGVLKVPFRPDNVNRPGEGTGSVVFLASAIAPGFRSHPERVTTLERWKAFQDGAIAKLDPKDAAAQKAGAAARAELERLLAAARDRAKEREVPFTLNSAPVELTIIDPAKKKP